MTTCITVPGKNSLVLGVITNPNLLPSRPPCNQIPV